VINKDGGDENSISVSLSVSLFRLPILTFCVEILVLSFSFLFSFPLTNFTLILSSFFSHQIFLFKKNFPICVDGKIQLQDVVVTQELELSALCLLI